MTRRLVVVGASAAGIAAADGARESGWDGEIVVVGAEDLAPYERPPLSKALMLGTEQAPPPLLPDARAARLGLRLILGRRVTELDVQGHRLQLDSGDWLAADGVVLATGARPRTLPVPGTDATGVFQLRTLADATALSAGLDRDGPVVIIGGGFIGLEVASAARARGREVTVVEAAAVPLPAAGGTAIGQWFRSRHEERGVTFATSARVVKLDQDAGGHVTGVTLGDSVRRPASTVVIGVGAVPRDELAVAAGLEIANGIAVDRTGRTSDPWVYAAGDAASHLADGGRERTEHWNAAAEQGHAAGRSIAGDSTPWDSVPYFWSTQYGLMLQVFGRPQAGQELIVRQAQPDRACWIWLREGRVSAIAGVGCPRDVRAGRDLIAHSILVSADQVGDPQVSLPALRQMSKATP
jgi:3-phenylpropionate/trans-cinnamate dioxygenase ferredoxin reductase component